MSWIDRQRNLDQSSELYSACPKNETLSWISDDMDIRKQTVEGLEWSSMGQRFSSKCDSNLNFVDWTKSMFENWWWSHEDMEGMMAEETSITRSPFENGWESFSSLSEPAPEEFEQTADLEWAQTKSMFEDGWSMDLTKSFLENWWDLSAFDDYANDWEELSDSDIGTKAMFENWWDTLNIADAWTKSMFEDWGEWFYNENIQSEFLTRSPFENWWESFSDSDITKSLFENWWELFSSDQDITKWLNEA